MYLCRLGLRQQVQPRYQPGYKPRYQSGYHYQPGSAVAQ